MNTQTIVAAGIITVALILPSMATASIPLDKDDKVELFGDVRLRIEADDRKKQDSTTNNRDRWRYRARFGVAFKVNGEWSGRLRLATGNGMNSPHNTFSTADSPPSGSNLGFDQAYIAFTGIKNLTVIGGKTGFNFWQQTEVFWDNDINPDAFALIYKAGSLTLNGAYIIVTDGGWNDDVTAFTYQAVYHGGSGGMKYTLAAGGATLDAPTDMDATDDGLADGLHADRHWIISGQLRTGSWRFGVDYLQSNADTEDTAYVAQIRFKINKTVGLRAYYYYVETFATPGDGVFTQDNFGSNEPSADNFKGPRLQLDYKLGNNSTMDVRYYDAKLITKGVDTQDDRSRAQINFNVKF
ncbi:MAG: putative porin [Gammaproteobacteria bacterium]|nr:putative porin [Gammaproteobacteria bacterium]